MSLTLGQVRSTSLDKTSLYENMSKTIGTHPTSSQSIVFNDSCLEGFVVNNNASYYLNFQINAANLSGREFKIYLWKDAQDDNKQLLRTFSISAGSGVIDYKLIFTPNAEYNKIIFELQRISSDYTSQNPKRIELRNVTFRKISNIITNLNGQKLKKIGVQGRPGLLMAINGEEIRVGKSGIYELFEGVDVSSIGFVLIDDDEFILDYQY